MSPHTGVRGGEEMLCEVKAMLASLSRYPRPPRQDGMTALDVRAAGLTADYLRKARNTDLNYGAAPSPPPPGGQQQPRVVGLVERRLLDIGEVRGWCFGAWGEASIKVHSLVQRLADARLEVADTLASRKGTVKSRAAERAGLVAYLMQALSFTAVKQNSKILLERLQLLGNRVGEATRRRDWTVEVEIAARRERQAQGGSPPPGRSLLRHGFWRLDMG